VTGCAWQAAVVQIGVVFPQTEIGPDAGVVRAYAEQVERMGYRHILVYDHVVGADPKVHEGWRGPYNADTLFHEPMVLFGYLAALTSLELVTGIIILPQRQTVLFAKQAAEVDRLTQGRFRCGIGLGWNAVEYEALGKDFSNRGRRMDEQIELLRWLWTEPTVTFEGEYERVTGAGLNPMPVQRPIPLWIGAASPRAYQRVGRLADGWFPQVPPGPHLDEARAFVEEGARAADRDPSGIQMEGRANWGEKGVAGVVRHIDKWRAAGATHIAINTMNAGLGGVDEHLRVLEECAAELELG
jgi:probable F420-dependent oxidoreductase